ncbi:MAG: TAT-variant-translocated molybdopterin oxidoreductase [Acidobacteriota bacterium]
MDTIRRRLAREKGPKYWRSVEELAEDPEFLDYLRHEFPAGVDTWTDPVGRRRFLQLMGASLALAGLSACTRQPEERLVPYVEAPENLVPGKPKYYASAFPWRGYALGVLVESHDGRPTKVEGNPRHPASLGATNVQAQASVLDLYDPDRLQAVMYRGRVRTWKAFVTELTSRIETHRAQGGAGLALVLPTTTSPTLLGELERLRRELPEARIFHTDALYGSREEGTRLAFGRPIEPVYNFAAADRVLWLDADPLYWDPGCVRYARDLAARRRPDPETGEMNRVYALESSPTVSSTLADHRLAVGPAGIVEGIFELAAALGLPVRRGSGLPERVKRWIAAVADDLRQAGSAAVVVPGEFQPPVVHALAYWINETLGAAGKTVRYREAVAFPAVGGGEDLASLTRAIQAGEISSLILVDGNPAYDAPADLNFAEVLQEVEWRAHLTAARNETSRLCHWELPRSHYLESWGDLRAFDGTATVVQPLIEPLYGSKSAVELLAAALTGDPDRNGYDLVREHWQVGRAAGRDESWWRRVLHDGLVAESAAPEANVRVDAGRILEAAQAVSPAATDRLQIIFRPDPHVADGRWNNNGWLQEAPKPWTRLTWDNAALVSPATAERLGVASEEVLRIEAAGTSIEIPAWILPGHPDEAITLHLGYGRRITGRVGEGAGVDVNPLRSSSSPWLAAADAVQGTGRRRELACTQNHYSMEGRALIREATLQEFRENPTFAKEAVHEFGPEADLYPGFEYKGHAWGMTVDLNACIGCNACVVACQAENNIAVVGREEVRKGREMHWMRIDRYFEGSLDDPRIVQQPVMCQHCENAPCETVCPVAATNHDAEGLNVMVYNRCVGTRYCSNNCPYKVRRFNFLLYSDWYTESLKLQRNPDVTVRSRGVMEKCTYCIQRINAAKLSARLEDRDLADGEIQTACQQVCPTQAITFGDLNDAQSRVAEKRGDPRSYGILTELKTKPRTSYLARVRNPNPELEELDG